jgi:hypothetical protein
MSNQVKKFNDYCSIMNELILGKDNIVIKRLFNLYTQTYSEVTLDYKTKVMPGLVASIISR